MILQNMRQELVRYGKEMFQAGLVTGTGGNLSMYDRGNQLVAITPSGQSYMALEADDMVIINLDGTVVEGQGKPSSEWRMHCALYRERDDISSVVHTHSPQATTLACLERDLPAIHYLIAAAGGAVRCAPYSTFGTEELARGACRSMEGRRAVLLARHGLLAGAHTISKAYEIASHVEYIAGLYLSCLSAGHDPSPLPEEELQRLDQAFVSYRPN